MTSIKKQPVSDAIKKGNYLLVIFIGLLILFSSFLLHQKYITKRAVEDYSTIIYVVMDVRLELFNSHLWLEEFLAGDVTQDINHIWISNNKATNSIHNIITNKLPATKVIDDSLKQDFTLLYETINTLHTLSQSRVKNFENSLAGSSSDQEFDKIFHHIINQTTSIENKLQLKVKKHLTDAENVLNILLLFIAITSTLVIIMIYRYSRSIDKSQLKNNKHSELCRLRYYIAHTLQQNNTTDDKLNNVLHYLYDFKYIASSKASGIFLFENNKPKKWLQYDNHSNNTAIIKNKALCFDFLNKQLLELTENLFIEKNAIDTVAAQLQPCYIIPIKSEENNLGLLFFYMESDLLNEPEFLGTLLGICEMLALAIKNELFQQALIKEKLLAQQANQAKSKFLSSMSHEFRTPLNSILGFSQLLKYGEDLSEDQLEDINHILSSGKHLLNIINEVLNLSQIESGEYSLSIKSINLTALINESISLLIPLAKKQAIHININNSSNNDIFIKADKTKFKQVIINILTNAIKYNKKSGTINISINVTDNKTVKVSIQDTGIGISDENQEKVFSSFNRLGHENSTIEGTGIGLVLTKNLVEMMDGSIGFSSILNTGSTFWVEMPPASIIQNN